MIPALSFVSRRISSSPEPNHRGRLSTADEIFEWLWSNFSILDQPKSGRVQKRSIGT